MSSRPLSGVAGLEATYAAVRAGKAVGLANKEAMVAAGEILTREARLKNVPLLPIDSEHNAIHQCMRGGSRAGGSTDLADGFGRAISHFAAGGVQRDYGRAGAEASYLEHGGGGSRSTPATMLNKGLEIIEACRLFDLPPSEVRVTIHPQSTVHSLVEFIDGSILAQISVTDMRLPILYAMTYPERIDAEERPDWAST